MVRVLVLATLLLLAGCSSPASEEAAPASIDQGLAGPAAPAPEEPSGALAPARQAWPPPPAPAPSEVVFLDVGHASAAVLHLPGLTGLVDLPADANGTARLHAYLDSLSITHIAVLLMTGAEPGECSATFQKYTVALLVVPSSPARTAGWLDCMKSAQTYRVPLAPRHYTEPGTDGLLGDHARIAMFEGQQTLSFRLDVGSTGVLFEGGLDCVAENALASLYDVQADLLVLGRHGAADTACTKWLQAARPQAAILSVGSNPDGLPAIETLGRMSSRSIVLHRTDVDGSLRVALDGTNLTVSPLPAFEEGDASADFAAAANGTVANAYEGPALHILSIKSTPVGKPPRPSGQITLKNESNVTWKLDGFSVRDDQGNVYSFEVGTRLASGATLRVHYMPSKCPAPTEKDHYWCTQHPPEATAFIELYDGASFVDRHPWPA